MAKNNFSLGNLRVPEYNIPNFDFYKSEEKEKRIPINKSKKDEIFLIRQQGKCAKCGLNLIENRIIPPDFHHIDGHPNNDNINNIEAICPNCHRKETFKQWREKDTKKKTQKSKSRKNGLDFDPNEIAKNL